MNDRVSEIDKTAATQIAGRPGKIGRELPAAREAAAKARSLARDRMKVMIGAIMG